jgi:hypothetical protein
MTEEQRIAKEIREDFLKRNKEDIVQYQSLNEDGKREFIKRRLRDYEDCPEKRKYESQI